MEKKIIINTHSHVNMLKEISVDTAIKKCEDENIIIIIPSYNTESMYIVDELTNKYSNVYGYVGIFPEEANEFSRKTLSIMGNIIKNNYKIIGIGEIGLDYYWDKTFVNLQKEIFIKQIEFANNYNLPINIHCREAYGDTLEILKKYNKNSTVIMHCYSGSLDFAKECIKMNMFISIGGVVTFKNAIKVKEVAKNIPLDHLLLETDDPYLTPVPYRGKENQPIYVKFVAAEIAKLRNIPVDEVLSITSNNAIRIFRF